MGKSMKQVRGRTVPRPDKQVRSHQSEIDGELRFRFGKLDHKNWPLYRARGSDLERLLKKMAQIESLTLKQARDNGVVADYGNLNECPNKTVQGKVPPEVDSITKIVIEKSGAGRMFAHRILNELHIIWYDPKHEVWPEGKTRR